MGGVRDNALKIAMAFWHECRPFGTQVVVDRPPGTSAGLSHTVPAALVLGDPNRASVMTIRTSVIIAPGTIFDDTGYSQRHDFWLQYRHQARRHRLSRAE